MSLWITAGSMRRLSLLPACGLVLLAGSPRSQPIERTGRITGTVELATDLVARRPAFRLYNNYGPGAIRDPRQQATNRSPAVVYLEGAPSTHAPATRRVMVEQIDERFSPHVVAVLQGTTIEFPNRDPYFHNVFSLSRTKSFDLGRYAQGEAASITLNTPGVIQVYCQIHSDMSGYILVLENAFFTVVGESGEFLIDNVPSGEYQLVAWHARTTPIRKRVRVVNGETIHLDFVLPLDSSSDGT